MTKNSKIKAKKIAAFWDKLQLLGLIPKQWQSMALYSSCSVSLYFSDSDSDVHGSFSLSATGAFNKHLGATSYRLPKSKRNLFLQGWLDAGLDLQSVKISDGYVVAVPGPILPFVPSERKKATAGKSWIMR